MRTKTMQEARGKTVQPCPAELQAKIDAKAIGEEACRHGDLMLIKAALPEGAKPLLGNEVLRSATTGHIHGVRGAARLFTAKSMHDGFGESVYVVVDGPAEMALHLEHPDAALPVGVFEARRKREGRGDYSRAVMD